MSKAKIPTCRVDEKGNRHWIRNGKLHRTDGPAIEWANGTQEWFENDRRHRLDGPAIVKKDGTRQFWMGGRILSLEDPRVIKILQQEARDKIADIKSAAHRAVTIQEDTILKSPILRLPRKGKAP